jgi:hypothetical protein
MIAISFEFRAHLTGKIIRMSVHKMVLKSHYEGDIMDIILNKTRNDLPEIEQSDVWLGLSGSKEQFERLIKEVSQTLDDLKTESA